MATQTKRAWKLRKYIDSTQKKFSFVVRNLIFSFVFLDTKKQAIDLQLKIMLL